MRLASEVQQLASRIDLHQSRREIFIELPNRFPEVLSHRALAGGRQSFQNVQRVARARGAPTQRAPPADRPGGAAEKIARQSSHHNKAYSFFRLRAGATLRGRRPNRFVLRNTDHAGDRLIDHVDDRVFDDRRALSWRFSWCYFCRGLW